MTGQRAPRRDAGSDLLRVELPLVIVGLQRHVAQLQHVGLYRQRRHLRLHVQRAVAQRDAVKIARLGDLAQAEAQIDAFGDQRLRLAVARQLHVFQLNLVRLAPRMGDFSYRQAVFAVVADPGAQAACRPAGLPDQVQYHCRQHDQQQQRQQQLSDKFHRLHPHRSKKIPCLCRNWPGISRAMV